MADRNLYYKQWHECKELYKQAKYTECIKLCLHNMGDPTMPRFFQIKTLLLLVSAEDDDWEKTEVNVSY
jgi:hypothetical protein